LPVNRATTVLLDERLGLRDRGVTLQEYLPRMPIIGKLRPAALLAASIPEDAPPEVARTFEAAERALGPGRAVWRACWTPSATGGAMSWELYLWSHIGCSPIVALRAVLAEAGATVDPSLDLDALDACAPLCASIDLPGSLDDGGCLRTFDVYVPLERATASYFKVSAAGTVLNGTQTRYEGDDRWERFDEALRRTPALAGLREVDAVVPRALRQAPLAALTQTTRLVGLYVAGLDLGTLVEAIGELEYSPAVRHFVRREQARLDHLRFDLGYGVRVADGEVEIGKVALYAAL
jgi:hypothetical protein